MTSAGLAGLSVLVLADQVCARVPGGTARYVEGLVSALAVRPPSAATLRAAVPQRCRAAVQLPVETSVMHVPMPVLARLWERGLPPRLGHGEVVHAPTLMVPTVHKRSRLVVTIHDVVPWTHPETLTRHGAVFHQRMGARAAREAATIVTPTEAVAGRVRAFLRPDCPVVAVSPGVRVNVPGPESETTRRGLGATGRYVLFVGTAEPRKGLDVLVAALTRPELADWKLVVVGPTGWGGVSVAELAQAAGVHGRVRVTGKVADQQLASLYAGAAAVAMPSRAEGFGFPVIEAMAHGIPVVISDDPALVEAAGGAATVVPIGGVDELAAGIAEAGSEGPHRAQRADAGRTRAATFAWERTAARMWSVYASDEPDEHDSPDAEG